MNDHQRKHIMKNMDGLISYTDFDKLLSACLKTKLLFPQMLQKIYRIEPSDDVPPNEETIKRERHKRLFEKITKRGPEAFDTLCRIFQDLMFTEALNILLDNYNTCSIRESRITGVAVATVIDAKANLPNIPEVVNGRPFSRQLDYDDDDNNTKTILQEYTGIISPKVKVMVRKSKRVRKPTSLETYTMESKDNRGILFMVNNIDFPNNTEERRLGAIEDTHSLLYLFKELGFKLFSYMNLTQNDFWSLLKQLLSSDYTKNTECFVMALMTHGNMVDNEQLIKFSDGSVVNVKKIEQHFYHNICKHLRDKPKIFLYPFCRGEISEQGIAVTTRIQTDGSRFTEPNLSDVCICYATSEGFQAHRDIKDGSWYIQSFVKNMAEWAHDTAFEDILKKIQADTVKLRTSEGHLQTGNYLNKNFNKILYFNPGCYKSGLKKHKGFKCLLL